MVFGRCEFVYRARALETARFLEASAVRIVAARLCRGRRRVGIDDESDQVPKGRSVDALALRGDEGRGTLR